MPPRRTQCSAGWCAIVVVGHTAGPTSDQTLTRSCETTPTEVGLLVLGEIVWARVPGTMLLRGKFVGNWLELVRLGKTENSDEHLCGDDHGARAFRTVRRQRETARWREVKGRRTATGFCNDDEVGAHGGGGANHLMTRCPRVLLHSKVWRSAPSCTRLCPCRQESTKLPLSGRGEAVTVRGQLKEKTGDTGDAAPRT